MGILQEVIYSIDKSLEDLKLNFSKAYLLGLAITLLYGVESIIPVIGGIIYGYFMVNILEKMANKKATKLAYFSAIALGVIASILSLLVRFYPKNITMVFISTFFLIILSVLLLPQIIFGVLGRKEFSFSEKDIKFYFGLILIGVLLGIPIAIITSIAAVIFSWILRLPILFLIVSLFVISPVYNYLIYKSQIEFAKSLISK